MNLHRHASYYRENAETQNKLLDPTPPAAVTAYGVGHIDVSHTEVV